MTRAWTRCWMRVGVSSVLALGAAGAAHGQTLTAAARVEEAPRDLGDFVRAYQADRSSISESANIPWSESWFDRQAALYDEWWGKLNTMNFDQLDPQGKIDWVLFRNFIEVSRSRLALDRRRLAEMDPLLPFRKTVQGLERDRRAMKALESASAAALVSTIDDQIKKCREGWDEYRKAKDASAGPAGANAEATTTIAAIPASYSPVVAQRAAEAVSSIRRTLDHWYRSNDGYLPEFSWWVREPYGKATRALDEYAKFLRETVAGVKGEPDDPLIGDPIGPEALAADLANEMIPYTPEQLMKIGERSLRGVRTKRRRRPRRWA